MENQGPGISVLRVGFRSPDLGWNKHVKRGSRNLN